MINSLSKILQKKKIFLELILNRQINLKKKIMTRKNIKIIGFGLLFCHFINIYKKTDVELVYKKNKKNNQIINSIKNLNKPYYQTPYFLSTCLEIFYGNIDKRETVKYKRKFIYTKNGEKIALDFCELEEKNENFKLKKNNEKFQTIKKPIVLLIPGLCGHSNSPYIKYFKKSPSK